MFERLANMYEEKKWEPQSFIRIHPNELFRTFWVVFAFVSVVAVTILVVHTPGGDLFASLELGIYFFFVLAIYAALRITKNNRRGWYLYEHEGKIIWYTGWGSERRLEIEEIAAIDFTGLARLKNHHKVKMPDPDETWYPFYLHLYQSYPALFEKKPVLYNPRRAV